MYIRVEFNVLLQRSLVVLLEDIRPSPVIKCFAPMPSQDNQSSSPTLDSPTGRLQRRLSPLCFWATMTIHICILGTGSDTDEPRKHTRSPEGTHVTSLPCTLPVPLCCSPLSSWKTTLAAGSPAAVSLCHQEAEPAV